LALKQLRKRGKHRPTLKAFASNLTEDEVKETSAKAFSSLPNSECSIAQIQESLKVLETLKGIGPATASYLLATYNKKNVPVFSDEAFRWVCWDKKSGWDRKIKYTRPEYIEYVEEVRKIMKRLGVGADEVEMVGWVLGKEKATVLDDDAELPAGEEKSTKIAERDSPKKEKPAKRTRKEKEDDEKMPKTSEPQRKSRRLAERS
jgi:hypothetical protein